MKKFATTLLIGALLAVGSAAQASDRIDASGFSLAWNDGYSLNGFQMNLLSDANGTARIAFDVGMHNYNLDTAQPGGGGDTGDSAWHQLAGSVQQGYRITSMTLSAVINGDLYLESRPCNNCWEMEGEASNRAGIEWSLTQGGHKVTLPGSELHNLIGQHTIELTAAQPLAPEFLLDISAYNFAKAVGTYQEIWGSDWSSYHYLQASSSIAITDYVLTVQVAPVPEPSTYAMLLAGLGVAGWAVRRRKG